MQALFEKGTICLEMEALFENEAFI